MTYEILRGCPMLFELLDRFDEEARSPDPKALGVVRVVEWLMIMNDSGRFPLAAEVGRVRARAESMPPAPEPTDVERLKLEWQQAVEATAKAYGVTEARVKFNLHRDFDEFVEALKQREPDIGPPPEGPAPIVGDPGWIPGAPSGKRTTTEIVATLQRRCPDDPDVRALIAKVTANAAQVRQAGESAAKAAGEADMLRRRLAAADASSGVHDVFAIFGTDASGAKAELRSVRREEPRSGEVSRDWLIVEKCRAIRDADGRLCLLEPVPSDIDEADDE